MYVYICACAYVCACVWGGGISDRDRRANFLCSKLSWLHILRYGSFKSRRKKEITN